MEKLSARQKYILSLLFDAPQVNIQDVSKQMDVSERTILREISAINCLLKKQDVRLVVKNPLLHMEGSEQAIGHIKEDLGNISKPQLLTTEQRILFIMAQLLIADEPTKSAFFSYQLDVSEATVSMYMEKIEKRLIQHNLFLNRQRTLGIQIVGTEWDKRNALVELIYAYKSLGNLLAFIYDTKRELAVKLLFDVLFGKQILAYTRDVLDFVADKIPDEDDIEYLNAFLYISISLKKSANGDFIQLSETFRQDVCSNNVELYSSLRHFFEQFPVTVPENEVDYIFIHLPGNQYQYSMEQKFKAMGISLEKLSEEVLYEIQKGAGAGFQNNRRWIDGLARQLNASICRAYMGIRLQNPLLSQVHSYYGHLYDTVRHACDLVFSKYNIHFSENEIGYITMYVGYVHDCEENVDDHLSVLIICPNGFGAARILSAKVRKLFPTIQKIEINSLKGWEENHGTYDLILSTVDIQDPRRTKRERLFVVSSFLCMEDVQRISQAVEEIRMEKGADAEGSFLLPAFEYIKGQASKSISQMFDAIDIDRVDAKDMAELIDVITSHLRDASVITDKEELKHLILNREKIGSVVIPNSRLALLHTRAEAVVEPYVGIYRLNGQMLLHNPNSNDEPVDTFAVLLARKNEHPLALEQLGNFSISLIDNPIFVETLRTGDVEEVRREIHTVCLNQVNN
ncbi:MAG: BglG family transcription antiterminator [Ethanoligenens sp.]